MKVHMSLVSMVMMFLFLPIQVSIVLLVGLEHAHFVSNGRQEEAQSLAILGPLSHHVGARGGKHCYKHLKPHTRWFRSSVFESDILASNHMPTTHKLPLAGLHNVSIYEVDALLGFKKAANATLLLSK